MSEGKQEARDVKDLSAKDVAAHIRYWWGNGHFDLVKTLEAWKPARQANQPPVSPYNIGAYERRLVDGNLVEKQPQEKAQPDSGEMEHWSDYRCPHCGLALTNEWINKVQRGAFQRGQQALADTLVQWCEQQTGDFARFFTPEAVAKVIRSLTSAATPQGEAEK